MDIIPLSFNFTSVLTFKIVSFEQLIATDVILLSVKAEFNDSNRSMLGHKRTSAVMTSVLNLQSSTIKFRNFDERFKISSINCGAMITFIL